MTYTTQPLPQTAIEKAGTIEKTEIENVRELLSLCASLNTLCDKLSRLEYVLKKNFIETDLTQKDKEK